MFLSTKIKEIKTENNIKKIIALQVEVDEVIKELDVTVPKYNCDNARKYQTPINPKFLKKLEEFKTESSKAKTEYLIKNANKLVESNSSSLKQQSVNRLPFVYKIMP
ncbi:hypothetical protein [Spiroplasma endosymbiont of Polydrusus pterygomalis]|uniref:hypothetical protein n=1 Tax=Spiroplasma endosymbiont of Polydrusus pterygomalis TaxID=3139327 RepID=UPI003CCA8715